MGLLRVTKIQQKHEVNPSLIVIFSPYTLYTGEQTNVRLFLILNPVPLSKTIPSYIVKWNVHNDHYLFEKFVLAGHNLCALRVRYGAFFVCFYP